VPASITDFSLSALFADALKKVATQDTIPDIFLIDGTLQALDRQRFKEWLKQCV